MIDSVFQEILNETTCMSAKIYRSVKMEINISLFEGPIKKGYMDLVLTGVWLTGINHAQSLRYRSVLVPNQRKWQLLQTATTALLVSKCKDILGPIVMIFN